MKLLFSIFALTLASAAFAHSAQTYFVSPAGDDSRDGLRPRRCRELHARRGLARAAQTQIWRPARFTRSLRRLRLRCASSVRRQR